MNDRYTINGLGQVARSVGDVERAAAWYRDVLGLGHLFSFDRLAFFDCGGTRLMLSQSELPVPPESILYFRVDDIAAAQAALEARGVEFVAAAQMIHRHPDGSEEWMAFFNDPDGRPLALMALKGDEAPA